jgi:hypothetical protein
MRNSITAIFLSGLLCAAVALNAQSTNGQDSTPQAQPSTQVPANQASTPQALRIAPGSVIPVQLTKAIDAKKTKTGDEITAKVTQDMKTTSGEVLVPKDTEIIGHVTEAQARSKEQKESQVGIAFDHAVVKGSQMQLAMLIQAVIAPPSNNAADSGSTPASGGGAPGGSASGSPTGGGSARAGGMGGGSSSQAQQSNYPQSADSSGSSQSSARPQITGNTQGVIGMPDVKLETTGQNSAQGSVVSSEKNNVKIEKGTMLLLKVQ